MSRYNVEVHTCTHYNFAVFFNCAALSSSILGQLLYRPSSIGFCPSMYHHPFFSTSYLSVLHPSTSVSVLHGSFSIHWHLICPPYPTLWFSSHYMLQPSQSSFLYFSLMFTTMANFRMSLFLVCSFNEILHIFLNILISVTSSFLSSSPLSADVVHNAKDCHES